MALRQGQRYVKVDKGRIADYLLDHNLIDLDDDVVFLVEKTDAQEG